MLGLENVSIGYGDIQIVHDVNMHVSKGELVVILGSNGAGKTTVLNAVAGILQRFRGKILFDGKDILDVLAHERSRTGIVLVPEGRQIFTTMGVLANLL